MPAITIPDLNRAKQDVDHIADVATSLVLTVTDRLGNIKQTVRGAVNTLAAFNARGAFAGATAYALKDVYTSAGIAYVAVIAHVSTSVAADLASGKVTVHQGATREELAASGAAALVGSIQSGAGAVNTSVQQKLQESFSVTGFAANGVSGARVDALGILDSTQGMQAALTAAAGSRLVVPPGTFLVSAPLLCQSNTEIYLSPGALIKTTTPNISLFRAIGKTNVHFTGRGKLQQTTAGASAFVGGIELNGSTDCTVDGHLEFQGFQWAGVYIVNSHRNRVTGTYMHDWLGSVDNSAGVIIYQDANDNIVENNHFKGTGWMGAYVQDPAGLGTYNPVRNKLRKNTVQDTTAYGLMLYVGRLGNSYNELVGNTISGVTGTAGTGQYGQGIYGVGFGLGGCKVLDNAVTNCCISQTLTTLGAAGIRLGGNAVGCVKPIISGNSVDGMTQGSGIQVISMPGGAVIGPNSVHIPASNNGTGPGGAALKGHGLFIFNCSDVSVAPGDYVNLGGGAAVQVLATDANYTGITLALGSAAAVTPAVVVQRTAAFGVTGSISGGVATASADTANAMQLLGFSGPVSGVTLRSGATSAALAALTVKNCPNVRFSNMDVECPGTYSVSISGTSSGHWDKNSRHTGRFGNSSAGFKTEFYSAGRPSSGIFQISDRAVNAAVVAGAPKAWSRATAGSAHIDGVDWISEGVL